MAFETVADYLVACRRLMQDKVPDYRYTDDDLVQGINLGLSEARRLRPDVFQEITITGDIPTFSADAPSDVVPLPQQYRPNLLYYMIGHATLIDSEDTQDARATIFLNKFLSQFMTLQA